MSEQSPYAVTIGLEIHAELKTRTKMFCGCINDPDGAAPNTHTCPVCMGYPGTLPVVNKEAVRKVLSVGVATSSTLADFTEFDRKNYFYPDIPKGYQISQYKYPLVSGGSLSGVALTRIHLEEDTARSLHEKPGVSLVDFNRAGVPLMELVTEPVIHSAAEVINFAKELQLLLRYLDVSDADMEKGHMRVEVNISVSKDEKLGTKVEVKNINSFRAAAKAVEYETARHISLLEKGEKVVQETRGFDESKGATFSQRSKENAKDYRYFADPDIPKFLISELPEFSRENLSKGLPEFPWDKRVRLAADFGLKTEDIELFVVDRELGAFFEAVTAYIDPSMVQTAANYIISDIVGLRGGASGTGNVTVESFARLISMIKQGDLSSRGAKDTLKILFSEGGDPQNIATENGLIQKNNKDELIPVIKSIIEANPGVVEDYKKGKEAALQFLVGQGMKATRGSANPEMLKSVMLEEIGEIH